MAFGRYYFVRPQHKWEHATPEYMIDTEFNQKSLKIFTPGLRERGDQST